MQLETVPYTDGDTECEGYLAFDRARSGPLPAVVVCHAWRGQGEFDRAKARALAELGYAGFCVDVYGKGRRGGSVEENTALIKPFLEDRRLLQRRLLAGYEALKAQEIADPSRLGSIGFCFGGLCALDLLRSGAELRGVVSFHGLLKPPAGLEETPIRGKALVLHGHDDPMVSQEEFDGFTKEMTDRGVDWQIHQYGHTLHAFTNPEADDPDFGTVYHEDSDRRSWIAMKNFFEEVFG